MQAGWLDSGGHFLHVRANHRRHPQSPEAPAGKVPTARAAVSRRLSHALDKEADAVAADKEEEAAVVVAVVAVAVVVVVVVMVAETDAEPHAPPKLIGSRVPLSPLCNPS